MTRSFCRLTLTLLALFSFAPGLTLAQTISAEGYGIVGLHDNLGQFEGSIQVTPQGGDHVQVNGSLAFNDGDTQVDVNGLYQSQGDTLILQAQGSHQGINGTLSYSQGHPVSTHTSSSYSAPAQPAPVVFDKIYVGDGMCRCLGPLTFAEGMILTEVRPLLESDNYHVRKMASVALEAVPTTMSTVLLMQLVADRQSDVSYAAYRVLLKRELPGLENVPAQKILLNAAQKYLDPDQCNVTSRQRMAKVIGKIAGPYADAVLVQMMTDPNNDVSDAAFDQLNKRPLKLATDATSRQFLEPEFAKALSPKSTPTAINRERAAIQLGRICTLWAKALLTRAMGDPHKAVRYSAMRAFKRK